MDSLEWEAGDMDVGTGDDSVRFVFAWIIYQTNREYLHLCLPGREESALNNKHLAVFGKSASSRPPVVVFTSHHVVAPSGLCTFVSLLSFASFCPSCPQVPWPLFPQMKMISIHSFAHLFHFSRLVYSRSQNIHT